MKMIFWIRKKEINSEKSSAFKCGLKLEWTQTGVSSTFYTDSKKDVAKITLPTLRRRCFLGNKRTSAKCDRYEKKVGLKFVLKGWK